MVGQLSLCSLIIKGKKPHQCEQVRLSAALLQAGGGGTPMHLHPPPPNPLSFSQEEVVGRRRRRRRGWGQPTPSPRIQISACRPWIPHSAGCPHPSTSPALTPSYALTLLTFLDLNSWTTNDVTTPPPTSHTHPPYCETLSGTCCLFNETLVSVSMTVSIPSTAETFDGSDQAAATQSLRHTNERRGSKMKEVLRCVGNFDPPSIFNHLLISE